MARSFPMSDDADDLYRGGAVSAKAYGKLKQLRGTKVQASKMAPFDGKGSKDEGGRTDRGDSGVASRRHIDQHQDIAPRGLTGNRATGRPSGATGMNSGVPKNVRSFTKTGGSVPGNTNNPRRAQIDQGEYQKPDWPAGTKLVKQSMSGASNSKSRGRIPAQGGQYGGGGRNTQ